MPRTLVCVRRAAAGRTCGEHQTIYEKASPVHKSNVAACLAPAPAPAPAAAPTKVSAKDTQVGLSSGLVNTAAGATSGDDVAGALRAARRSK